MSCDSHCTQKSTDSGTDWSDIVQVIAIFILIVLCAGSPDLLDAIIHRVMNK